jgi:hypothetical protein
MLWASSRVVLDAVHLPTRPSGAKEGVLVAWGYTRPGSGCCWTSGWASGSASRVWRWAAAWSGEGLGRYTAESRVTSGKHYSLCMESPIMSICWCGIHPPSLLRRS